MFLVLLWFCCTCSGVGGVGGSASGSLFEIDSDVVCCPCFPWIVLSSSSSSSIESAVDSDCLKFKD